MKIISQIINGYVMCINFHSNVEVFEEEGFCFAKSDVPLTVCNQLPLADDEVKDLMSASGSDSRKPGCNLYTVLSIGNFMFFSHAGFLLQRIHLDMHVVIMTNATAFVP